MSKDAVVFDKVTVSYPNSDKRVLNEVSLTIKEGEFITILGNSGCGKTTMIKVINKLLDPVSGSVTVFGRNLNDVDPYELRRSMGYVIQQIGLFPHMTVEQNIGLLPRLLGWNQTRISERVTELLSLVRLDPELYRKRYPRQLSGGQQQRVGIARAMVCDPEVLLMDEPFGAIDEITRHELQEELLDIYHKLKKTILFVTHDVKEALNMGTRVLIMGSGEIQQFDTPSEIMLHPANEFVAKLVDTDSVIRQLEVQHAGDFMLPYHGEKYSFSLNQSAQLFQAIGPIMEQGDSNIAVIDSNGAPIGLLDTNAVKKIVMW